MSKPFHTYGELAARRLTGNFNTRKSFFGKQILQVEVLSPNPSYPNPPPMRGSADVWKFGSLEVWKLHFLERRH